MKFCKTVLFSVVFSLLLGVSALAAPDILWAGDVGNTSGLMVITKPPKDRSATFDRSYMISGYGKEGTVVTIYKLSAGGYFTKTAYTRTIGASTFFVIPIRLETRKNVYIAWAEDSSGSTQGIKLEITYLGNSLTDAVRNVVVDPGNVPI